jgi:hypothetical protein
MYLDIDLQGNIGQVLLAHSEHMLGQATLWDDSNIGLALLFQITFITKKRWKEKWKKLDIFWISSNHGDISSLWNKPCTIY